MLKLFILASCVAPNLCMEGFIVGGDYANIEDFPHSVLSKINCEEVEHTHEHFSCGSSIINQQILLSAAHCLYRCTTGTIVGFYVGNAVAASAPKRHSFAFALHQHYSPETFENDIMLFILDRPLELNSRVGRVALMRNPPYTEPAVVAGWGLVDEDKHIKTKRLKSLKQKVWKQKDCLEKFSLLPGTFCASSDDDDGYPSMGDSGSALMVRGYIQIGIVSYKLPTISREVLVYTDIGYFFDWIKINTKHIYCSEK